MIWYLAVGAAVSYLVFTKPNDELYETNHEYRVVQDMLNANPIIKLICFLALIALWFPVTAFGIYLVISEKKV